jgi:DNA-binding transcriptional ArsR family regulator
MPDTLDLEMRRRLFALARDYPGLHVREAARQLETSVALVEYHAAVLTQAGLVRQDRAEGYVRLFAVGDPAMATAAERDALALLRRRIPLSIALHILDQDQPVQHKAICDALGISKSKLSFHLRKLEAAGLVRKNTDGRFEPVARGRLMALLLAYRPTPDLMEEFGATWLSLYGDKR